MAVPKGFVKAETVNDALVAFNKGFWSTALGYATWPVMAEDYQGHLYRPVSYGEDEDEDEDRMPATPTQESWCGAACWPSQPVSFFYLAVLAVSAVASVHACADTCAPAFTAVASPQTVRRRSGRRWP